MSQVMKVRHPDFDFSDARAHWAPNAEAAQIINGGNVSPVGVEPFLIKVLRRAKGQLDPVKDADLIADIETFNKQEGQHMKMHSGFLKLLQETGYDQTIKFQTSLEADYERFLNTKSLRWLLAYCEGFESLGSSVAAMWVDGSFDDLLEGADEKPQELWRWHLAEEFEHRTVVYRAYHALYGKPLIWAWAFRVYGFLYDAGHQGKYVKKYTEYLLAKDREGMSVGELAESKRREKIARKALPGFSAIGKFARVFSPFYNPANTPPPKRLEEVLAHYL